MFPVCVFLFSVVAKGRTISSVPPIPSDPNFSSYISYARVQYHFLFLLFYIFLFTLKLLGLFILSGAFLLLCVRFCCFYIYI